MRKYVAGFTTTSLHSRGFTLIELLIAIAIIGILASGLLLLVNPVAQIQKANDARRKSDLGQIQKGLEQYYNDHNQYPISTASYQITGVAWGSQWTNGVGGIIYMQTLPKDPKSPSKQYVYVSTGQSYFLYASLDNTKDSQVCNSGAVCTNAASLTGSPCGTGFICNYGVSSSNVSP